jgi:predicted O-methyltransferase YrrM
MHMHEIIERELTTFCAATGQDVKTLQVLETGTIRQDTEAHRLGDGWSTVAFARAVGDKEGYGHVTSIDLHIETAEKVIEREGLADYVTLLKDYSINRMARMLAMAQQFDVILLDSENDAQLILHEFMIARQLLRRPGLFLVDDVVPGPRDVVKGQLLLPWLAEHHMEYSITERTGGGVRSGVLAMVLP